MEFIRYLFYQGYHQNQITILVTYKDQLLELQKVKRICMNYKLKGVDSSIFFFVCVCVLRGI